MAETVRALLLIALGAVTPDGFEDALRRAWRAGDAVALQRAADAAGLGGLARLAEGTRADRLAALAAAGLRDDGLLLIDAIANLAGSRDQDTARAAARTARRLLGAATRDALEALDLPRDALEGAAARLLAVCGRRDAPSAARIDALFALAAFDRLSGQVVALPCATLASIDPDATFRLAAVVVRSAGGAEVRADLARALAVDPDAEVAAQAALALCRLDAIDRDAPRVAELQRADLPPPLAADLRSCLRGKSRR
ncbi:MAG: hypothetical protein AABZ30_05895 [Myxococcota bacterium]